MEGETKRELGRAVEEVTSDTVHMTKVPAAPANPGQPLAESPGEAVAPGGRPPAAVSSSSPPKDLDEGHTKKDSRRPQGIESLTYAGSRRGEAHPGAGSILCLHGG